MVKVSVVIPVYNVEDFLGECLDSIVNQTLKDIEIICINDGSKDRSLEILNEYASKDDRITVISQENGGHAVATNNGMELATGKYLFLMDSDDILKLNALEDTVKVAEEKNVDFVIFQAINYYMDRNEYVEQENYSMNRLADFVGDKVFNYKDVPDYLFKISVTPWSKLYNREFVINSGAKFPEGLIFDDNVFFWRVFFNAKRIAFHRDHLFIRRWYSSSSTMAGDQRFMDSIDIYNLIFKTFIEHDAFEDNKYELYNRKIRLAAFRYLHIKDEFKEAFYNKIKDDFTLMINHENYDDFINNLYEINFKRFNAAVGSENLEEFDLRMNNIQVANENKNLNKKNKKLEEKLEEQKTISRAITGSSSWKVTKPLRDIKNKW